MTIRQVCKTCLTADRVSMGDADEVNQKLLATSTASVEGVRASERWMLGSKKRGGDVASKTARKKFRSEARTHTERHLDDEDPTEADSGGAVPDDNSKVSVSPDVSATEALVHSLMTYVFDTTLGGRHNASRGGETNFEPPARAVLCAERSTMRPVAAFSIHHAVYGSSSTTRSERVVEEILKHRKKLRVCSYDRDLVGGFLDGKPLHTRQHLLALVKKGLRGEQMQEMPQTSGIVEAKQETKRNAVVLFSDTKSKSLSSFLQDSSSSLSNDSDGDDGDN
ncbi:hypothetical protein TCDM_04599 [Trypanosoma cruzi Dm28c]|uniref:Uncharacterized protein n=2 Tax=Trypanosoma cruzi TaxID=5693 RepID=V5DH73_TRYCR|nr:hypothetical protein TCDM_04599 [Trypanosoma cruzi Dm28c]